MKIAIGTASETKIEAVRLAVEAHLPGQDHYFLPGTTDSGVPDQPVGHEQILKGAINRARSALEREKADIAFGLEGGTYKVGEFMLDIGLVYIIDNYGRQGLGGSRDIKLSAKQKAGIEAGKELSDVIAEIYQVDTKSTRDCSGVMTRGLLPSTKYYQEAAELALVSYIEET